ncbi:unnamed protein product [Paramecium octaurelia]|uniref:Uncharacterized protein n=1 Tax=Paramecium octaurelia TaxID=43137 RepID=A0A8S1TVN5_PAROT|nr:unnamed protein product [Paramecium octaurelia]
MLLSEIRQISTLKSYPIISKIELKYCYSAQNQLRINYNKINVDQMATSLQEYYQQRIPTVKYQFTNLVKLNTNFFSDEELRRQIIDIIMENSIKQTNDGLTGVTFENDARQIAFKYLFKILEKGLIQMNLRMNQVPNFLGLYSKLFDQNLGSLIFQQRVNGHITNKGLRIMSTQSMEPKFNLLSVI